MTRSRRPARVLRFWQPEYEITHRDDVGMAYRSSNVSLAMISAMTRAGLLSAVQPVRMCAATGGTISAETKTAGISVRPRLPRIPGRPALSSPSWTDPMPARARFGVDR